MSEQTPQKKWDVIYQVIRFKPTVKALTIVKTERGTYIFQMKNDKQSTYIQPTAEELAYLSILFGKLAQEQAQHTSQNEKT